MIYSDTIKSINDVPKKENQRNCTDIVCIIIGILFGLFMFIMALVLMKKDNYYKANFPTDSNNIPCGYGQNQKYSMIYFPDVEDKNTRVCVSVCPNQGDKQLICKANSKVSSCKINNIYQTTQDFERLGGFCLPADQGLKAKLIEKTNLSEKWRFLNTYDIIRLSLIIAFIIGIIWLVLVQVISHSMAAIAIFLSVFVAAVIGILLIVDTPKGYQGRQILKFVFGIIFLLITAFIIAFMLLYKRRIKLMGLFLAWSTEWARQKIIFVLWIPIFILCTLGLIVLVFFQHLAFMSHNDPQPHEDDIYLKLDPTFIWQLLNIIQFVWGLQFLKDSFNFIISGSATQWYLQQSETGFLFTFLRMIKYHLGSIIGGSFLNAFFNIINFIFESLRCYPDGRCNMFAPCCNLIFGNFTCFLCKFVRTDVYSYINMAGIPYCNACRNCEVISKKNTKQPDTEVVGAQTMEFFYRVCSYISCVGISFIICYFIEKGKLEAINVQSLFMIALLSYCILAYFIDFHADAAEGIHVASILERVFGPRQTAKVHQNWKNDLAKILQQETSDGTC